MVVVGLVVIAVLVVRLSKRPEPEWFLSIPESELPADWQRWPIACLGIEYRVAAPPEHAGEHWFDAARLGPYELVYDVNGPPRFAPTFFAKCLRHPRFPHPSTCFQHAVGAPSGGRVFDHLQLRYSAASELYIVSNGDTFVHAFRDVSGVDLTPGILDCTPPLVASLSDSSCCPTAGRAHQCVVIGDGERLRCWGDGAQGQLGYGTPASVREPATGGDVDVGGYVRQASAGFEHTCAVRQTGGVRCWGNGADGRLGYGNTRTVWNPALAGDIPLGGPAQAVAAGYDHTCALLATGHVKCWGRAGLGYGNDRTIGDDETPEHIPPVPLPGLVNEIALGRELTCVLMKQAGEVRCWAGGESARGARRIALPGPATEIKVGGRHACARVGKELVVCWGENGSGELCTNSGGATLDGSTSEHTSAVAFSQPIYDFDTSPGRTCMVLADGETHCCGDLPSEASVEPTAVITRFPARFVTAGGDLCTLVSSRHARCLLPQPHQVTLF